MGQMARGPHTVQQLLSLFFGSQLEYFEETLQCLQACLHGFYFGLPRVSLIDTCTVRANTGAATWTLAATLLICQSILPSKVRVWHREARFNKLLLSVAGKRCMLFVFVVFSRPVVLALKLQDQKYHTLLEQRVQADDIMP